MEVLNVHGFALDVHIAGTGPPLVYWEIDHKLQREGVRPIMSHYRAATCWNPRVKGLTIMQNSLYNGWRFEEI